MAAVQSLSALLQQSSIDDHDEIIKACNATLKKSKNDLEAQHVKAVALLKQDRFDDAIRVFEEGGDVLKQRASLEWAYALYKIGKLEEAIEAAATSKRGRGARHVEAQAAYRAEKFQRTRAIYQQLCEDSAASAQEHTDLRINMTATDGQLQWVTNSKAAHRSAPGADDLEIFEITYNIACEYIARGEYEQARQLLRRAKELCRSSEDLSDEEKQAELVPIAVQELFIVLQQGRIDEITNILQEINVSEVPELSTRKIAQNNMLVAIEGDSNPYLKHKRFHEIPFPSQSDKLFQYQEEILNWSSMTVELLVHKYDGVARSTSKLLSQQKSATLSRNINSQSIFNVAAHTRNEGGRTAIKQVVSSLEKHPYIVGFVLLAVQLFVSEGNISSAVSILELFMKRLEQSISESDQEIRYNPGLVSVLISLYRLQGRKWQINAEFAKAATFWRQRPQQEQPLSLLRAAASSLLQSQDPSDIRFASEIFDALHTADPTDGIASIGHVACHGATSTLQAKDKVSTLSPVQDLISDVDVASLEAAGIPSMPTTTISASRKRKAGEEKDKTGLQKKRVRKSHLPKDYDPNKKPDPERWLPLRDRSTYRPKGKKGKQKAADRTQGGVVSEKAADSAPSAGVVQQKSGGNSKKKKSKGKR